MDGDLVMGKNEQFVFSIIEEYRIGEISRKEASNVLGKSERTIDRLVKRIADKGLEGLVHGNKGRTPVNKTGSDLLTQVESLVKQKYFDFNMLHCHEMLQKNEHLDIGYQPFRRLCHDINAVKRKKKIRRKNKYHRDRMACEGMLLQMDGSHHQWNGKDKWCLIAMIDDATSQIPHAEFFKTEDTLNCLKVLESVIAKKGIPRSVYVDKAGWFGGTKRQEFSQFLRAAEELNINVIFANSPEAKGRIERAWQTFQDRLIPELRLSGLTTMEDANWYLWQNFLPNYWEKRNTVEPRKVTSKYQPIPSDMDTAQHCCLKEIRIVRNDLTILWDNNLYRIDNTFIGPVRGRRVEIRTYWDGNWQAFLGRIPLTLNKINQPRKLHLASA